MELVTRWQKKNSDAVHTMCLTDKKSLFGTKVLLENQTKTNAEVEHCK